MDKVVLIGYSLGADVLPFMASRLKPDLVNRVVLIALLGIRDVQGDYKPSAAPVTEEGEW